MDPAAKLAKLEAENKALRDKNKALGDKIATGSVVSSSSHAPSLFGTVRGSAARAGTQAVREGAEAKKENATLQATITKLKHELEETRTKLRDANAANVELREVNDGLRAEWAEREATYRDGMRKLIAATKVCKHEASQAKRTAEATRGSVVAAAPAPVPAPAPAARGRQAAAAAAGAGGVPPELLMMMQSMQAQLNSIQSQMGSGSGAVASPATHVAAPMAQVVPASASVVSAALPVAPAVPAAAEPSEAGTAKKRRGRPPKKPAAPIVDAAAAAETAANDKRLREQMEDMMTGGGGGGAATTSDELSQKRSRAEGPAIQFGDNAITTFLELRRGIPTDDIRAADLLRSQTMNHLQKSKAAAARAAVTHFMKLGPQMDANQIRREAQHLVVLDFFPDLVRALVEEITRVMHIEAVAFVDHSAQLRAACAAVASLCWTDAGTDKAGGALLLHQALHEALVGYLTTKRVRARGHEGEEAERTALLQLLSVAIGLASPDAALSGARARRMNALRTAAASLGLTSMRSIVFKACASHGGDEEIGDLHAQWCSSLGCPDSGLPHDKIREHVLSRVQQPVEGESDGNIDAVFAARLYALADGPQVIEDLLQRATSSPGSGNAGEGAFALLLTLYVSDFASNLEGEAAAAAMEKVSSFFADFLKEKSGDDAAPVVAWSMLTDATDMNGDQGTAVAHAVRWANQQAKLRTSLSRMPQEEREAWEAIFARNQDPTVASSLLQAAARFAAGGAKQ